MIRTIGFDASVTLAPNGGGIARYTLELLKALVAMGTPNTRFVVLLNSLRHSPGKQHQFLFDSAMVEVVRSRWPGTMVVKGWGRNRWPRWEDLVKTPCDLVHAPAGYLPSTRNTPVMLTIHDLAFLREKVKSPLAGAWFEKVYQERLDTVVKIITPSRFVACEVVQAYGLPAKSVQAIHSGIDTQLFPPSSESDKSFDVLAITSSGIERKRSEWIAPIIEGAERLLGRTISCSVLGGTVGECPSPLILQPRLTDQELAGLYGRARVVLFPTKEEGFGFPVLESLACGTPVVCGKNSSLTEVGGDIASFSREDTIEGFAETLADQLRIKPDDQWEEKARSHAQEFNWKKTAQEVFNVYMEALR